jgi:flagellin-like hook-associated protein FlgL
MLTSLDPSTQLFLAGMNAAEQSIQEASSQMSSGYRINQASDAPDQISPLLQLRSNLQQNQQIQTNLGVAQTEASSAQGALQSAASLMDRAVSLATQGASSTVDAASLQTIAQEVQSLQQQMVHYSGTTVQGRYLFMDDQSGAPPYTLDPTSETGVTAAAAAGTFTRVIQDPAGGSFTAGQSAQQIFDARNSDGTPASGNVFAALNSLYTALQANDTTAIADSVDSVQQASTHLNASLAFYGTVQNRIQVGVNYAGTYGTQLQTQIGQLADTDIPSAAMELTQATTQLQAGFQMEAHIPHTSLFNYLG